MKAIDSEKCAIAPRPSPQARGARMKLQRRRRFVTAPPFFRRRRPQRTISPFVKITRTAEKTAHTAPAGHVAFLQRTISLLRYNADFLKGE
ncbi:hypothetical protein [Ralstonia flatus]|uniref:hypothetical protein n=1 Tax=Ralstonia flatus TaxID=3058601 RepID=UPI001D710E89|nr:hypothetical protein [Ralstonia sp. LMG 32965]MBN6211603.1 hypothetical protein [Ralstonia pickettii]